MGFVTPPEGPPENELNPMLGLGSGMGGIMPFFTHTPQTSKRPTKTKPKKGEGVEEEKNENLTLVALGYTEDTKVRFSLFSSSTPSPFFGFVFVGLLLVCGVWVKNGIIDR